MVDVLEWNAECQILGSLRQQDRSRPFQSETVQSVGSSELVVGPRKASRSRKDIKEASLSHLSSFQGLERGLGKTVPRLNLNVPRTAIF